MEYLRLSRNKEEEIIERAIEVMLAGGVVAFPTETFYGLGVHYDNREALARLYELKRRPFEKAIPVIIGKREQVELLSGDVPEGAEGLMDKYWPGPLTIVLHAREGLQEFLTAGSGKVAVRIPGESFALRLAERAGFPFTATSANPSGVPPAQEAVEVLKYFGEGIELIVDGGATPGGMPSTIVEVTQKGLIILRKGVIRSLSLNAPMTQ